MKRSSCHAAAGRAAAAVLLAAAGGTVQAQVGASVSLVSDYRLRGVSLSAGRPALQANIGYDSPHGWYAGAFASAVDFGASRHDGRHGHDVQLMAYGGYAGRLRSGWSWEAGATRSLFPRHADYDYAEVFGGLAFGNVSARLVFSPDYFGRHARTLYAEINASHPVREWLHLFAHVGLLRARAGSRLDARVGVGITHGDWRIQLARVGADTEARAPAAAAPAYDAAPRPAPWTVQVTYFF